MTRASVVSLECYQSASILLLHPNLHGCRTLLVEALSANDRTTVFVSVPTPGTKAIGLFALLQDALREQGNLTYSDIEKGESQTAWARRFCDKLAELAPYRLILESIDLAEPRAMLNLLRVLADRLPADSQIVLSSRSIPCMLLNDDAMRKRIVLAPVDESAMLIDYSQPCTGRTRLEVRALGPGRVLINGRSVDDWDGALPRNLFFYLLDRGMATRDEVFQNFWPDMTIREATNVYHVTKRKVNEILGFDLVTYSSGYYQLVPGIELHYDVSKFIEAIQYSAVAPRAEAIEHLERAVALYRGEFLSSAKIPWARNRRLELRSMYAEALVMLSDLYTLERRPDMAAALQERSQWVAIREP